jgi:hypothetical protein
MGFQKIELIFSFKSHFLSGSFDFVVVYFINVAFYLCSELKILWISNF